MSERERWIVYPLLFLALGASLRDKLIKQTTSDKVICKELYCERVLTDGVLLRSGNRWQSVMQGNSLGIANIEAGRILQGGQPVMTSSNLVAWLRQILGGALAPSQTNPSPPAQPGKPG